MLGAPDSRWTALPPLAAEPAEPTPLPCALAYGAGGEIVRHAKDCGCESPVIGSRGLGLSKKAVASLLGVGSGGLLRLLWAGAHGWWHVLLAPCAHGPWVQPRFKMMAGRPCVSGHVLKHSHCNVVVYRGQAAA
jgi:hypothetical protein